MPQGAMIFYLVLGVQKFRRSDISPELTSLWGNGCCLLAPPLFRRDNQKTLTLGKKGNETLVLGKRQQRPAKKYCKQQNISAKTSYNK